MIDIDDLYSCLSEAWLVEGHAKLERNLLLVRLGLAAEPLLPKQKTHLTRFSQAVIAGASRWGDPANERARKICQTAADIEAGLAIASVTNSNEAHRSLLKAMILYDLAGLPGASATYAGRNGFDARFREFFSRAQKSLWGAVAPLMESDSRLITSQIDEGSSVDTLLSLSLGEITQETGIRMQAGAFESNTGEVLRQLGNFVSEFDLQITGDDLHALSRLVHLRQRSSTIRILGKTANLNEKSARGISLPVELWPAQISAIEKGILNEGIHSFGFAAPTGTGKTSLTRLVIAEALETNPEKKILYLCPSRALVAQVTRDLNAALSNIGIRVVEVGAHLTVHEQIPLSPEDADVLIFTPERADLLLRVAPEFLDEVCLIIVDEAHHIEQAQRGVLLEFYLWRLRKMVPNAARIVQLSAVTPNISELTNWLGEKDKSQSLMMDWRSSRLRVGVLQRSLRGAAILSFDSGPPYQVLSDGELPSDAKRGIAILANHLSKHGVVLVLCMSPKTAEEIAKLVRQARSEERDTRDEVSERLDAWIERELYPDCPLREYYKYGVVYHHAKVPPRVRGGIEEAIKARKVDVICATTTLAEGVNFPFSTVVVESLVGKNHQLSPRALWNIAGRAGRFGVDTEGHCIIYRPELWQSKLKHYNLEDYLRTKLADIPPVISALASGVEKLFSLMEKRQIAASALESISLADIKVDGKATAEAKEVRSLINIMRVGYAHASSSGLVDLTSGDVPEFTGGLLASQQLKGDAHKFAETLGLKQRQVVLRATKENDELVQIAARVGWSLEAQMRIYDWVAQCKSWQLEQFGHVVVGGAVLNFSRLGYVIGPLAKNLLAFEGESLGGFTSFVAEKWIRGIPLSGMEQSDFGELVSTIYGRIQYLLPWGLYGLHELVEYEAKQRGMIISTGIRDLSVLAAEGVPDFDALQLLMQFGIERVDAARLSTRFRAARRDVDILAWFSNASWPAIERIVRGSDNRRVDPTLQQIHSGSQNTIEST